MMEFEIAMALAGFILGWIGNEIYEYSKRSDRWH
jgi:hypothetical protein